VPHPDALSLRTYFGLKEALERLPGRPVDLLEPGALRNPYLKPTLPIPAATKIRRTVRNPG
jgi:predicted nucleotidyltransferase